MNIIYINHYAGSPLHGMEYRPYYLAREWVRSGNRVHILAASFSHVRSNQPNVNGKPISRPTEENIDGIEYIWYPTPSYHGNGVGRVLNIWSFLKQVWRDAKPIVVECKPDVVIASSTYPLDIWVARRIAKLANAKLIFEVHDLWPLSPIELGGMSPYHPFIWLCQRAENSAYRHADTVVSMLPKIQSHVASHGFDLSRLHIIPNGISLDEWGGEAVPIAHELAIHIKKLREQNCMLVGYAGSHGLPNALDTLLDAAALLRNEPIHFVLVGDGHEKERLLLRVKNEGLSNVKLFPPIPKMQIPALLKEFDVLFIGWQNVPIYRFGIGPNKLMDYMMAGRTILHSVTAGNDPVADANCGVTVPAESPQAIADALLQIQALTTEERAIMGRNGRTFVERNHSYQVLAQRFISFMKG